MASSMTDHDRRAVPEEPTQASTTPCKDSQQSPKRKVSEAAAPDTGDGKKKRRKVNHACVYCRRSHMTCDLERPCARCVKRDIGHLCHDEPREPAKRTKSDMGIAEIAPAPKEAARADGRNDGSNGNMSYAQTGSDMGQSAGMNGGAGPPIAQPKPVSPTQLQRPAPGGTGTNNLLQNFDWNNSNVQNQFQDMHHLHPNYMFNTSEVTNEYNLLNDFLSSSLMDDGGIYNNDDTQTLFNDPLLTTSSVNALSQTLQQQTPQQAPTSTSQQPPPQTLQPAPTTQAEKLAQEISRPSSTYPIDTRARDAFYLTAADPAGLDSASDRLHKLLRAKYDAGMLKPFNYVKGYARLNSYMSAHLSKTSQLRILKQLSHFRPKFREAMHSLTDMQLVLVEMWFERQLMDYDRVFASMAIPACCWRRTGEIFRGNTEMAELLGVPTERLRDGKVALHELLGEDSLVSYWEKFGAIAFDQSQKAILTSCVVKVGRARAVHGKGGGGGDGDGKETTAAAAAAAAAGETDKERTENVRCCFSFTIRRDTHNIPSLIVGNFLPIR